VDRDGRRRCLLAARLPSGYGVADTRATDLAHTWLSTQPYPAELRRLAVRSQAALAVPAGDRSVHPADVAGRAHPDDPPAPFMRVQRAER
jgi:hypothetical protein